MVAALHQKRLGVVMDVVFNHTLGSGPETDKSRVAGFLSSRSGGSNERVLAEGDGEKMAGEAMSRESKNQNCMAGSLFDLVQVFFEFDEYVSSGWLNYQLDKV